MSLIFKATTSHTNQVLQIDLNCVLILGPQNITETCVCMCSWSWECWRIPIGTHTGVVLSQLEIKHKINSSTVLNKLSSFGEQKYQEKLLLSSLPLWIELDEGIFFFPFLKKKICLLTRSMSYPHCILLNNKLL